VRAAAVPPVRVESQKLSEGVWLLGGDSHNSVLVEFRDFVTLIEAPLNEARSLALLAEVHRLTPNKPIRYVVNTHNHFDHLGGVRTFVSEGATIITHERNREFYQNVVLRPGLRLLEPDRLSLYPRAAVLETMSQKFTVSDGERTLDLYPVQGLAHAMNMLVAYLPKEKILVNADLYSPPASDAQTPAPSASMVTLNQTIQRLKLDVARHVPIHGAVGTGEQFARIMAKPGA
jgi:glyoxylase-like metal-dependent hydrolase (beta-lactamase superfamily II)